MNLGSAVRDNSGDKGEMMKAKGNRTAKARRAVVALFAALLLGLAVAPHAANAAKVDNPSPPNFRTEITGGFLEVVGTTGTALGIPMDFASFELPNPAFSGTVTTNANGYGVITVPNTTYPNCVAAQTPAGEASASRRSRSTSMTSRSPSESSRSLASPA